MCCKLQAKTKFNQQQSNMHLYKDEWSLPSSCGIWGIKSFVLDLGVAQMIKTGQEIILNLICLSDIWNVPLLI